MVLTPSELNPPDVQKIVVEHIVRTEDKSSHFHPVLMLRPFSGKPPRSLSEVDYDTWRSYVDLMKQDHSVSDPEKSWKIFESLLIPASDIIRQLDPEYPPTANLQMLDSSFATVEDGEELFEHSMSTLQLRRKTLSLPAVPSSSPEQCCAQGKCFSAQSRQAS